MRLFLILLALPCCANSVASAQQTPDVQYHPPVICPAWPVGCGPRVLVDEAHHNFHTADGRYRPFAELLRADGFRVDGLATEFNLESLRCADVLVIVNALNERNVDDWSLPTPSAFSNEEIQTVRCWVHNGGSLLLIADHMPFPGSADQLARAFSVVFSNGYVRPGHRQPGITDTFEYHSGLWPSPITQGRYPHECVTRVATFTGSAFTPPLGATPVLLLGTGSISQETTEAPGITPDALEVPVAGWCQGAVFQYGWGRVAVFGEAAMFTAQLAGDERKPMGMNAPGAEQNHQLLLNVMHWLIRR